MISDYCLIFLLVNPMRSNINYYTINCMLNCADLLACFFFMIRVLQDGGHIKFILTVRSWMASRHWNCCKYMTHRWFVMWLSHWFIAPEGRTTSAWFHLTHRGRDKMDAIAQTRVSSAFSWMKMYEFRLRFHWNSFLRVELTIFQHWFR